MKRQYWYKFEEILDKLGQVRLNTVYILNFKIKTDVNVR
jgi:hypothetical protein